MFSGLDVDEVKVEQEKKKGKEEKKNQLTLLHT